LQAAETPQTFPIDLAKAQDLAAHPLALLLLTPFILIFLWAAWLEIRRWWLYGPSRNKRADFPIDESAPSYEDPSSDSKPSGAAGPGRK
jgi:hypothetical protein